MGTPLATKQEAFQYIGKVTAAITTPVPAARSAAEVEALAGLFIETMPAENAIVMRFSGVTNDSVNVYDIMFMAGEDDHYTRVGTVTATTGTQVSGVEFQEFADTVAVTNEFWHQAFKVVSPGDDYIGEISVDVYGVKKIALIPTTIVTGSSVWYRGV